MRLFKTSKGDKSHTTTIAWITFIWVLSALTLGLIESITIGEAIFKFRMLDASIIFCLLGPTYGLYGFRRYTDKTQGQLEDLRK